MDIKAKAQEYSEYTISNRRAIHMNPELQFEEFKTAELVRKELDKMGIAYREVAGTGTFGSIGGKKPGKTVLLRADMDALPVQEQNECEYASKVPNVMHACGHDSHTAMLLTACRILKDMEDEINGTVKFIFQPSEENGQGAKAVLKENILEGVDAIFGCHVWADVESGKVAIAPGPVMAGANKFEITVTGKQTHGAAPHLGVDALSTACGLVESLQTIVSREIDPQEPCVVTVGSLHSGSTWNVVPETAEMVGTTRCFSNEVNDFLPEAMERIVKNFCESRRCEGKLVYTPIVAPTTNDEALAKIAVGSVKKTFGEDAVTTMKPTSGGEDFSIYEQYVPGAFCMIGIYNPDIDGVYANHHGKFKVDEAEMVKGAGLMAQMAVDYLNS